MGTWYEIAKYPNRFQKNCEKATATYQLRDDGKVAVINRCQRADGSTKEAEGKAWVVDPATNAKLKVSFFWPFAGNYWIVELGSTYEYVVVSEPKRKYLWILSRTESLPDKKQILGRLEKLGFNLNQLSWSR